MSNDPEALYQLSRQLIEPQLQEWLRNLAAERRVDAAEPSETERAA